MAFSDLNNDNLVDLIILAENKTMLLLYYFNEKNGKFEYGKSVLTGNGLSGDKLDFLPVNVVASDFGGSGRSDLIVMGLQADQSKDSKEFGKLSVKLFNQIDVFSYDEGIEIAAFNQSQPVMFDYNGNLLLDFAGQTYNNSSSFLSIFENQNSSTDTPNTFNIINSLSGVDDKGNVLKPCRLSNPHSSAFVDLNGDCLSVCETSPPSYQIWLNGRREINGTIDDYEQSTVSNFGNVVTGTLPIGTGQISFADMDRDGTIDMVFPVCTEMGCEIHIAYNDQIPLCINSKSSDIAACRSNDNLCSADPKFSFDFSKPTSYQKININDLYPNERLDIIDGTFGGPQPVQIQIGDYDLDGYPDILVTTIKSDTPVSNSKRGVIGNIWNQLFGSSSSSPGSNISGNTQIRLIQNSKQTSQSKDRRLFKKFDDRNSLSELSKISNPTRAAFFDIDENGTLDILVNCLDSDGKPVIKAVYNNFDVASTFFMRASINPIILSNYTNASKKISYSNSYKEILGGNFKCLLSNGGRSFAMGVTQLPSSNYRALNLPFGHIGLGKFNNYIDKMYVGISSSKGLKALDNYPSQKKHENSNNNHYIVDSLIPNSKLAIYPNWVKNTVQLRLFLSNGGNSVNSLLYGLVVTMTLLFGVVYGLDRLERNADLKEKQKEIHAINFDAL
ncbi:T-cell immunomodulatory protein [Smittium culicis]|uniref:T-cell immunomodulatory protein n=1 Tax=Smittium culicis TaxID=133412 RepID=A0A1R1XBW8_9FUNG|nr:T-cell immunomodulatory protein [Smittium culicis]